MVVQQFTLTINLKSISHTSIILLSCWKVSVTSSSYFLHVVVHVMTVFSSCCSISPSFYRKNRIWIIPKCPLWSIPYYGWRDNSSTLHVHFQSSGKNAVTLPLFLLLPWNWMMLWNGIDFFTLLLPSSSFSPQCSELERKYNLGKLHWLSQGKI